MKSKQRKETKARFEILRRKTECLQQWANPVMDFRTASIVQSMDRLERSLVHSHLRRESSMKKNVLLARRFYFVVKENLDAVDQQPESLDVSMDIRNNVDHRLVSKSVFACRQ